MVASLIRRILTIENCEGRLTKMLKSSNVLENYKVIHIADAEKGMQMALNKVWQLIIVDTTMEGIQPYEQIQLMRERKIYVPVIVLLTHKSMMLKPSLFNLGANDFIIKPFSKKELLLRVTYQLEAYQNRSVVSEIFQIDDLVVEKNARKATREGKQIELTPKEFDLLLYLVQHKGQVLSRRQITTAVWGYDFMGNTNLVDVYIRYLRQKVDKGFKKKLIHTSRGIGYFIKEP